MPAVHRLAGRASLPAPAQLPPLRLLAADAREACPKCGEWTRSSPAARASSASPRRWPSASPMRAVALLSSDLIPGLHRDARRSSQSIEAGEADIIIGTQMVAKGHHFPRPRHGRHRRRRSGPGHRRPARRRAHLPAAASGDRPRRPRAGTGGRGLVQTHMPDHPVMQAIISGDREAFLDREIRQAPGRPAAAVRPARRPRRLRARQGAGGAVRPRYRPTRAAGRDASRCWARPKRRSPSSAAATAGACSSRRRASSTCRPICAPGLPPCRNPGRPAPDRRYRPL